MSQPMGDEKSDFVRLIRINMEGVGLAKEVGQEQIVLAAVPFATDPADAIHQPQRGQFGDDEVLCSLTVELKQVNLVDAYIAKNTP